MASWFRNAAAWGGRFSQSQEEETRDKTPERKQKRTETDHRTPNRDGGAEETGARHRVRHDESTGDDEGSDGSDGGAEETGARHRVGHDENTGGFDSGCEDDGSDGSLRNITSDDEGFDYSGRPLPEKEDDGDDDATESAVEAPRLGAPRGERTWNPVQVATMDTKKQAIAEGKTRVGGNTTYAGGNSYLYYAKCGDHANCPMKFKVQPTVGKNDLPEKAKDYSGAWGVYVDASQTHAGTSVPYEGLGVSNEWRGPFKLRFEAGFGPRGATVDLQAKLLQEGASTANFPSKEKITAFYNALKAERLKGDIKTNAELLERAQELKVSCLAELESKGDTDVIVIDFMSKVVWVDEEVLTETVVNGRIVGTTETMKVQKTAITVIYSCKLIVLWILALHALGFVFDFQADGTYRLMNLRWVTVVIAMTHNTWDTGKSNAVTQCQPLFLSVTRTECFEVYFFTLDTLKRLPTTYSSGPGEPLGGPLIRARCGGLDRCEYIAQAYLAVWPAIILLLCWAHIARKFKEKMDLKHTTSSDVIEKHIHVLHGTAARFQFDYLAAILFVYWSTVLDEERFAKNFRAMYMVGIWAQWFVTASGIGGVCASSNPIESWNRLFKVIITARFLRAILSYFIDVSLVKMIITMANPYGKPLPNPESVSIRAIVTITAEWVNEARNRARSVPPSGNAVNDVTNLIPERAKSALNIKPGAKVFVVNRETNETSATDARARQYFTTFGEPQSDVTAVSAAQLTKALDYAQRYHVVTFEQADDPKDMNLFLKTPGLVRLEKARELFDSEEESDVVLRMTCTSELFFKTGDFSVEILMVLDFLGFVNLELLSQTVTGRRRAGRQASTNWAGATRSQRTASWFARMMKKNGNLHFLGYRVVLSYEDTETVGVVQEYNNTTKQFKIFFAQYVGTEENVYDHLDLPTLAVALNKAKDANLSGPPPRPIIED